MVIEAPPTPITVGAFSFVISRRAEHFSGPKLECALKLVGKLEKYILKKILQ